MSFNQELAKIPGRVQNGLAGAPGFNAANIIANVDLDSLSIRHSDACMAAQLSRTPYKAWCNANKVSPEEVVEWGLAAPYFEDSDGHHCEAAETDYYAVLDAEWKRRIKSMTAEANKQKPKPRVLETA